MSWSGWTKNTLKTLSGRLFPWDFCKFQLRTFGWTIPIQTEKILDPPNISGLTRKTWMNFWISRVFQKSVSPTLKYSGHFAKNPVTGYHLWEIPIDLGKIPNYPTLRQNSLMFHLFKPQYTLQGTNISHLGKRKIIFKSDFWWDMLDTKRA